MPERLHTNPIQLGKPSACGLGDSNLVECGMNQMRQPRQFFWIWPQLGAIVIRAKRFPILHLGKNKTGISNSDTKFVCFYPVEIVIASDWGEPQRLLAHVTHKCNLILNRILELSFYSPCLKIALGLSHRDMCVNYNWLDLLIDKVTAVKTSLSWGIMGKWMILKKD